jgi:hypothetical protein
METAMDWRNCPDDREKYQLYLASREWAVKRDAVRTRSGGICERCRINPLDHVHHLTYIRKYDERPEDLEAMCKGCHEFTHNKSSFDPANHTRPIHFDGVDIYNFYLAGKMDSNWRVDLIHRGEWNDKSFDSPYDWVLGRVSTDDYWSDHYRKIHWGYRYSWYSGPFHGGLEHDKSCHSWSEGKPFSVSPWVNKQCMNSIDESQLIFCWIDSLDSYGTIAEIGYARGITADPSERKIILASPKMQPDLWFAYSMCDYVGFGYKDARHAWMNILYMDADRRFDPAYFHFFNFKDYQSCCFTDDAGVARFNPQRISRCVVSTNGKS